MEHIVEKHKSSTKLYGLGAMAAGVFMVVLGIVYNFQLTLWRIPVGRFGLILLGAISCIGGVVLLVIKEDFCKSCDKALARGEAYMPLAAESLVMEAYRSENASGLMKLEVLPKNTMKMELSLDWCEHCGQVGRLSVTKWENYESFDIGKEKELFGPGVAGFAELVAHHVEARGDDDD